MPDPTLCHFAAYRFTTNFWRLDGDARSAAALACLAGAATAAPAVHLYQGWPSRGGFDFLLWSAVPATATAADELFARTATALAPHRRWVEPGETLWGLTRPSPYVRQPSSSALDPFAAERLPYLVVYPFVKTHEWYRLPLEERRRQMGEHIAVGRRYEDVRQLLLYAYGLGDQDFVVVYETADPGRFSELVGELRATAARGHTARDTPVWVVVHRGREEAVALWAPRP
jgi:chlorite dismutase